MASTADPKTCASCDQTILPKSPSGQGWTDKDGKTTCATAGTTHRPE